MTHDTESESGLPELPEPVAFVAQFWGEWRETNTVNGQPIYTADMMRAYATAAIEKDRAERSEAVPVAVLHPAPTGRHPECEHGCSHPARVIAGPCQSQCVKTPEFVEQSSADAEAAQLRFATQIGANQFSAVNGSRRIETWVRRADGKFDEAHAAAPAPPDPLYTAATLRQAVKRATLDIEAQSAMDEDTINLYAKQIRELTFACHVMKTDLNIIRTERDALRARLEVTPQGPDGIDARDETIRVLEGERDKLRADAESMRLPSSYGGSTFDTWGDQNSGCTIRIHFTDATQAEAWFTLLTDEWDAARGMGEAGN